MRGLREIVGPTRLAAGALVLCLVACASDASAQRRARRGRPEVVPGVAAELTPYSPASPPGDPRYLFALTLRTTTWPDAEVVADRRLLRFEVYDPSSSRARPLVCAHPDAPRLRALSPRTRALGGMNAPQAYREWIDLRMYCTGRALERAERGGRIVATFGSARAARGAWVARVRSAALDAPSVALVPAGAFTLPPRLPVTAEGTATEAVVSLSAAPQRTEDGLSLAVSIRSPGGPRMVYLRHDYVRFRVRGPLGMAECGIASTPLAPIVDLFRPVSPRTATTIRVDARQACRGSFPVAGVYEVAPVVSLPWAFPGDPARAITGEYAGNAAVVRVTVGERGYVEHIPEGESR